MCNRWNILFATLLVAGITIPACGQTRGEFAKPETVGLSSDRLAALDAAMQDDVDQKRKAGMVVLVARHGKIAHLKSFGMSNIEASKPMTVDAVFRLHSQSKPMVSVGLLMLYEQGKFALNDPLENYIPSFAKLKVADVGPGGAVTLRSPRRKPTILDALRHTTGFPATSALAQWGGPVEKIWMAASDSFQGQDLAAQMELLADLPLAHDPGTDWRYGPSHDVQGRLIEIFSGMSLGDYMRERVFKPLKLKDTGYVVSPAMMARYTTVYVPDGKGSLVASDKPEGSWYIRSAQIPSGSSGISSTAYDQFRFGQMLLDGGELDGVRLLSRKTVEMMLTNQLPAEIKAMRLHPNYTFAGFGYGLGISVVTDLATSGRLTSLGAASWGGSSTTDMVVDPQEDMIIVSLAQYRPGQTPWWQRAENGAYQALIDSPGWKKRPRVPQ